MTQEHKRKIKDFFLASPLLLVAALVGLLLVAGLLRFSHRNPGETLWAMVVLGVAFASLGMLRAGFFWLRRNRSEIRESLQIAAGVCIFFVSLGVVLFAVGWFLRFALHR